MEIQCKAAVKFRRQKIFFVIKTELDISFELSLDAKMKCPTDFTISEQ